VSIIKQLNYVKKPWCCVIKIVDPFFITLKKLFIFFSNFKHIAKTLKQKIIIKLAAQQTFLIGMLV